MGHDDTPADAGAASAGTAPAGASALSRQRRCLVDWMRSQLIGPAGSGCLSGSPVERYPTGVLHPVDPGGWGMTGLDPAEEDEDGSRPGPAGQPVEPPAPDGSESAAVLPDDEEDESPDGADGTPGGVAAQPAGRRRYVPPSSVGVSFCVRGDARLRVTASAASYRRVRERDASGRFVAHRPDNAFGDGGETDAGGGARARYERTPLAFGLIWPEGEGGTPPGVRRQVRRRPSRDGDLLTATFSERAEASAWATRIDVRRRPYGDGHILTVVFANRRRESPRGVDRAERRLFEARLECAVEAGELVEYPRVDPALLTDEEQEIELRYRGQRIYAIGHGAAADWAVEPGRPPRIWSEHMPAVDVPLVTTRVDGVDDGVLVMRDIAGRETFPECLRRFEAFAAAYGAWVGRQRAAASRFTAGEWAAAKRICARMDAAWERMRGGVERLRRDDDAALAFRLANQAMLDQMRRHDSAEGRDRDLRDYRWRPFQLAFLLAVIESTLDEQDVGRDVLDLIWFPTGGGKTEAYLGLIAFLIVWRRLRHGEAGGGTAVLMRYTLRLLTRQQFERAARLVCALERLRRQGAAPLGEEPITVGLWVGAAASPNTFEEAAKQVAGAAPPGAGPAAAPAVAGPESAEPPAENGDLPDTFEKAAKQVAGAARPGAGPAAAPAVAGPEPAEPPAENGDLPDTFEEAAKQVAGAARSDAGPAAGPAVAGPESAEPPAENGAPTAAAGAGPLLGLQACPWCGRGFAAPYGYRAGPQESGFLCGNPACAFGDGRPLPCHVVDEALYERPPALLIGTIDKFARLVWDERAAAFFGRGVRRPPELVIQDELHLVAGPLGSVAGVYEAALDTVLERRGVRPKYIASTATIRTARDQVRRLYGRGMAVFPPPGLSADDSWFARTDRSRPGRLYVGYLAPGLDQQHCLAPLAAVLLAAPRAVFEGQPDADDLLDAWWTQVVYHGSLRGVGASHNAFVTDVRTLLRRLDAERAQAARGGAAPASGSSGSAAAADGARLQPAVAQLTSRSSAQENARTFDRLAAPRGAPDCLDAVLATNMLSVGVDVDRLAAMVINGQPLTTAEYIQASSRIGRGGVPGLVVANYFRHQARSLSHYENFRPYHESFYRFVEPTSVTPFTYQVRKRALHAALVTALRHGCGDLTANDAAGRFRRDDAQVQAAVEALKRRCRRAAGDAADDTARHLDRLVDEWHDEAARCRRENRGLRYDCRDQSADRLLGTFDGARPGRWKTLNSMRNVEDTTLLSVRQRDAGRRGRPRRRAGSAGKV